MEKRDLSIMSNTKMLNKNDTVPSMIEENIDHNVLDPSKIKIQL